MKNMFDRLQMSQCSAAIGSWENVSEKAFDQMFRALNNASSKMLKLKNCTSQKILTFFLECLSAPSTCFYNRYRIDGYHSISISIYGLWEGERRSIALVRIIFIQICAPVGHFQSARLSCILFSNFNT